ncbi:hypothetical protein WDW37_06765 [Bdellovibrionota bacterium FG-1]
MAALKSHFKELGFRARTHLLGRLRFRPGLPAPVMGTTSGDPENRFYRELLIRAFLQEPALAACASVIDVGARNWTYLPALCEGFPKAAFTGIEVDGYRRYANLFRRRDQLAAQCIHARKQGRRAEFWLGDFRAFELRSASGSVGSDPRLITFFYPFVSEDPCSAWGLPNRFAQFHELLVHARGLSATTILSVHQGAHEFEIARAAYAQAGFAAESLTTFKYELNEFKDYWPARFSAYGILQH